MAERPSKKIAGFLTKTYDMVENPKCQHLIHWSESGESFVVTNKEQLSRDVLPQFFKHSNFSSFIRQLNMYGFRKIGESHHWEFAHEHFKRGRHDLLTLIRRKSVSNSKRKRGDGDSSKRSSDTKSNGRESRGASRSRDVSPLRGMSPDEVEEEIPTRTRLPLKRTAIHVTDDDPLSDAVDHLQTTVQSWDQLLQQLQEENVSLRAELGRVRRTASGLEEFIQSKFPGEYEPASGFITYDDSQRPRKRSKPSVEIPLVSQRQPFSGSLPSLGLTPKVTQNLKEEPMSPGFHSLLTAMDKASAERESGSKLAQQAATSTTSAAATAGNPPAPVEQTVTSAGTMSPPLPNAKRNTNKPQISVVVPPKFPPVKAEDGDRLPLPGESGERDMSTGITPQSSRVFNAL